MALKISVCSSKLELQTDMRSFPIGLFPPSRAPDEVILATRDVLYGNGPFFISDQFFSTSSAAAAIALGTISNVYWFSGSNSQSLSDYIKDSEVKA